MERAALCAVALCCKWVEGRSRSWVPQEVCPVVPVTTCSPRLSFRARSSHCQVLALPLIHSPRREVVSGARSHRRCPPHDFWAYVGVLVIGTCSTVRVQEDVGGGGRLQGAWLTRALKRASSRRGYQSPPCVPRQTPSTVSDVPHTPWLNPLISATCKSRSLQSRCVPTLKCNVTSKTRASDTFNCKLPRCQRATLYAIPPSVCTMFLHMYEQSLPKLVGGVMATGLHSRLDVEVEPCCTRWS